MTPRLAVAARRMRRAAGAALVALAGLALPSAQAAVTTPVSITALQVKGTTVTGILSVSQATTAVVDNTTLTAIIGGRSYPVKVTPATELKRATMIVVDTSGSMGDAGMATVRSAVSTFLAQVPKDVQVGLTSFSDTAKEVVAPTLDRAKLSAAVNALQSKGETSLYDAVVVAAAALSPFESRTMVLLSDGGDTVSRATAAAAADALRKGSIWTAVIGFRTAESDNSVLSSFATASGGKVAAAGSPAAVSDAFLASAKALTSQITFTVTPGAEAADANKLVITGEAGGRIFQTESAVSFARDAWPAAAKEKIVVHSAGGGLIPRSAGPTVLIVALVGIALGVFGLSLAFAGTSMKSSRSTRVDSIERYLNGPSTKAQTSNGGTAAGGSSALSQGLVRVGERVMQGRDSTPKTMRLIERADLPLRPGEWWVLRLLAAVVGGALTLFFLGTGPITTPVALLIGAPIGYVVPLLILKFLAKRRSKKFEAQLPDVLMLLASSLSTGFSLAQGLDAVARDAAEPLAKEISRALAETRIGVDVSDALERMSDRMESTNMRWTSMAIRIQREVGGNLAETLRTTAGTLRERESLHRQVRALSAEGRMSAYVLVALPVGVFLYMLKVNRPYVALLWQRPVGMAMLGGGVMFLVLGIVWMRKLVDVEV